jgi:hypothetical protein
MGRVGEKKTKLGCEKYFYTVHTEHGRRCSQEAAGEREIAFARLAWPGLGFNSYWQMKSFL